MRQTFKEWQGYKYYVYVAPGVIEYFREYQDAQEYAQGLGAEVQEV